MKKIMIPCDFSDESESALKYAIALAQQLDADLVLLHVDMIPVVAPEMNVTPFSYTEMEEDSLNALKNLADKIKIANNFNNRIDYFSEMGSTPDVIHEQVQKLGVDLVVMGISGHGSSFMKNLIGSASVDVSKRVTVPVIIVPPATVFKKIKQIAFGCSYDPALKNSNSLALVKQLTLLFEAELALVHVVPADHALSAEEAAIDKFIEKTLAGAGHRTFTVNEKHAGPALLNFISTHNIDLLIIETKKHSFLHNVFGGGTTSEIAFNSPVPVLTIHNEPQS